MNYLNLPEALDKQGKKRADCMERTKNPEREFVGFTIEVLATSPIQFEDIGFSKAENNFWPPGWSSKGYKSYYDILNDSKSRSFIYSMEPTWVKVSVNRNSRLLESDIKEFVKSQVP